MAESDKKTTAEKLAKAVSAPAPLGRASESGDPAVHQILAERQTAVMNGDVDAAAEYDRRLADLGYE